MKSLNNETKEQEADFTLFYTQLKQGRNMLFPLTSLALDKCPSVEDVFRVLKDAGRANYFLRRD